MSSRIDDYINGRNEERKKENNFRSLKPASALIDFTSNDYLGFARDPELKKRVAAELLHYPDYSLGSTGSRLLTGNSAYAEELESMLANFHHADTALIFNSGFTANYGLLSSLPYRGDTVIYDELVHASVHDGIRHGKADKVPFLHNNLADLEQKLSAAKGLKYVVVESLYSMDGDFAPLQEIAALCEKFEAGLIVDEAHANGLYGKDGSGLANQAGIEDKCLARIYTFGKAIGSCGAAVVCAQPLKEFLLNYCRPFIFSTALPFTNLAVIKCAYGYLSNVQNRREYLIKLAVSFKKAMREANFSVVGSSGPIQSIVLKGNDKVKALAEKVRQKGFDVRPILYPTVPKGTERIRVCLHSFNTEQEVNELAKAFVI
ncbi:MAG: 8-amino-7-oxononanoate synthase [Chitinophagales bacterium]